MKRLDIQDLIGAGEWMKYNGYSYLDVVAEVFASTDDLDYSILIANVVFGR